MKPIYYCLFLALISLSAVRPKLYQQEKLSALQFLQDNQQQIHNIAGRFELDQREVLCMVFPELMRYSLFRDFLETSFLEILYVQKGSEMADFSIGPFQMKPSFVEKIEQHILEIPSLQKDFAFIAHYDAGIESEIRSMRLKRLQSLNWQLYYAYAFTALMDHCYGKMPFGNKTEKLRWYATAYNVGFDQPVDAINKWLHKKAFPYGAAFQMEQLGYADISLDFYHQSGSE